MRMIPWLKGILSSEFLGDRALDMLVNHRRYFRQIAAIHVPGIFLAEWRTNVWIRLHRRIVRTIHAQGLIPARPDYTIAMIWAQGAELISLLAARPIVLSKCNHHRDPQHCDREHHNHQSNSDRSQHYLCFLALAFLAYVTRRWPTG